MSDQTGSSPHKPERTTDPRAPERTTDEALEHTFPASDAPAITPPAGSRKAERIEEQSGERPK